MSNIFSPSGADLTEFEDFDFNDDSTLEADVDAALFSPTASSTTTQPPANVVVQSAPAAPSVTDLSGAENVELWDDNSSFADLSMVAASPARPAPAPVPASEKQDSVQTAPGVAQQIEHVPLPSLPVESSGVSLPTRPVMSSLPSRLLSRPMPLARPAPLPSTSAPAKVPIESAADDFFGSFGDEKPVEKPLTMPPKPNVEAPVTSAQPAEPMLAPPPRPLMPVRAPLQRPIVPQSVSRLPPPSFDTEPAAVPVVPSAGDSLSELPPPRPAMPSMLARPAPMPRPMLGSALPVRPQFASLNRVPLPPVETEPSVPAVQPIPEPVAQVAEAIVAAEQSPLVEAHVPEVEPRSEPVAVMEEIPVSAQPHEVPFVESEFSISASASSVDIDSPAVALETAEARTESVMVSATVFEHVQSEPEILDTLSNVDVAPAIFESVDIAAAPSIESVVEPSAAVEPEAIIEPVQCVDIVQQSEYDFSAELLPESAASEPSVCSAPAVVDVETNIDSALIAPAPIEAPASIAQLPPVEEIAAPSVAAVQPPSVAAVQPSAPASVFSYFDDGGVDDFAAVPVAPVRPVQVAAPINTRPAVPLPNPTARPMPAAVPISSQIVPPAVVSAPTAVSTSATKAPAPVIASSFAARYAMKAASKVSTPAVATVAPVAAAPSTSADPFSYFGDAGSSDDFGSIAQPAKPSTVIKPVVPSTVVSRPVPAVTSAAPIASTAAAATASVSSSFSYFDQSDGGDDFGASFAAPPPKPAIVNARPVSSIPVIKPTVAAPVPSVAPAAANVTIAQSDPFSYFGGSDDTDSSFLAQPTPAPAPVQPPRQPQTLPQTTARPYATNYQPPKPAAPVVAQPVVQPVAPPTAAVAAPSVAQNTGSLSYFDSAESLDDSFTSGIAPAPAPVPQTSSMPQYTAPQPASVYGSRALPVRAVRPTVPVTQPKPAMATYPPPVMSAPLPSSQPVAQPYSQPAVELGDGDWLDGSAPIQSNFQSPVVPAPPMNNRAPLPQQPLPSQSVASFMSPIESVGALPHTPASHTSTGFPQTIVRPGMPTPGRPMPVSSQLPTQLPAQLPPASNTLSNSFSDISMSDDDPFGAPPAAQQQSFPAQQSFQQVPPPPVNTQPLPAVAPRPMYSTGLARPGLARPVMPTSQTLNTPQQFQQSSQQPAASFAPPVQPAMPQYPSQGYAPAIPSAMQPPMPHSHSPQPGPMSSQSYMQPPAMSNPYQAMQQPAMNEFRPRPAHPIVSFGFGGRVALMFPERKRQLGTPALRPRPNGSAMPTSQVEHDQSPPVFRVGLVKLRPLSRILATQGWFQAMQAFPGPLNSKTSASDLTRFIDIAMLHERNVTSAHPMMSMQSNLNGATQLAHKQLLWQVLLCLCAHESGLGSGSSGPDSELVKLFLHDSSATTRPLTLAGSVSTDNEGVMQRIQQALLNGHREDACRLAVEQQQWALALLLSANLQDPHMHRAVIAKFASASVNSQTPLHSLLMLLAGAPAPQNTPSAADNNPFEASEWRRTLAMILANPTSTGQHDHRGAVQQLGDALWKAGACAAAHICYLIADETLDFTPAFPLYSLQQQIHQLLHAPNVHPQHIAPQLQNLQSQQHAPGASGGRLILLGADHRKSPRSFHRCIFSLLRTEMFEHAKSKHMHSHLATLGGNNAGGAVSAAASGPVPTSLMQPHPAWAVSAFAGVPVPTFQSYKLLYAAWLADLGELDAALKYVESIQETLKALDRKRTKFAFSEHFVYTLQTLEDRLRTHTNKRKSAGLVASVSSGVFGLFDRGINFLINGTVAAPSTTTPAIKSPVHSTIPTPSAPIPTINMPPAQQNPIMQSTQMGGSQFGGPIAQPMQAQPQSMQQMQQPSYTPSNPTPAAPVPQPAPQPASQLAKNDELSKTAAGSNAAGQDGVLSSVGGFFSRMLGVKQVKQANLEQESEYYYDEAKGRWVCRGAPEEPEAALPPPPPPRPASTPAATPTVDSARPVDGMAMGPPTIARPPAAGARTPGVLSRYALDAPGMSVAEAPATDTMAAPFAPAPVRRGFIGKVFVPQAAPSDQPAVAPQVPPPVQLPPTEVAMPARPAPVSGAAAAAAAAAAMASSMPARPSFARPTPVANRYPPPAMQMQQPSGNEEFF